MTQRICSVRGCNRTHYGKTYCQLHYNRVRVSGSPGPAEVGRLTPEGLCAQWLGVADPLGLRAGAEVTTSGRVHRTGAPGPADLSAAVAGANDCAVDGCSRAATRRGYCGVHYRRWRQCGDPGLAEVQPVSVGDDASYGTVHARLRATRGAANEFLCLHCDRSADDWAYDYTDPAAKWDPVREMLYSLDLNRYLSLCKKCHVTLDRAQSVVNAAIRADQWPIIRVWARDHGWIVSDRGRLARKVIVAYLEAHSQA